MCIKDLGKFKLVIIRNWGFGLSQFLLFEFNQYISLKLMKFLKSYKFSKRNATFDSEEVHTMKPGDVFLVRLETSWIRARNELHDDYPLYLVPSCERARSQPD